MLKHVHRLQDPKTRITSTGGFFLGRSGFYAFQIDFRYFAVRKSIISGVYWL